MVSDLFPFVRSAFRHFYLAFIDQLLQEAGVMDHFIIASQFGVFIFQGIKTMRTGRYNFFYLIAIQHLDVAHGLHLKQKLIQMPHPERRKRW